MYAIPFCYHVDMSSTGHRQAAVGKLLDCERESTNPRHCLHSGGEKDGIIIGHVPRKVSEREFTSMNYKYLRRHTLSTSSPSQY